MTHKEICLRLVSYASSEELPEEARNLVQLAKEATKTAYAPYSKFHVGAAVLLANGKVLTGNNQENAASPSGLCAERTALFYANAQYPEVPVKAIAVAAFAEGSYTLAPITPCGSCRQVMLETEMRFGHPIRCYFAGAEKIYSTESASDLLPLQFSGDSLP